MAVVSNARPLLPPVCRRADAFNNMHFPTVETQMRRGQISQEQLAEEIKRMLRWRAEAGFP